MTWEEDGGLGHITVNIIESFTMGQRVRSLTPTERNENQRGFEKKKYGVFIRY